MKLADYIRGTRHGREAHGIELDAMRDPLLGEALEGFDAVPGDHSAALERLAERVRVSASGGRAAARARASRRRESRIRGWSVAAAAVFLVGAVGGGVWLLRDGIITDPSRPVAHRSGGYYPDQEEAIMPPVTVIPNDAAPTAPPTDMSDVVLDSEEVRDFSDIAATEPTRDTTLTIDFREYANEVLAIRGAVFGRVTLSFEVGGEGRPANIAVVESLSPEAAAAAVDMLSRGPGWPSEPAYKLITIDL